MVFVACTHNVDFQRLFVLEGKGSVMTRAAFDINKTVGEKPGAKLPMLGMTAKSAMVEQFPIQDVDAYLAALHASIGDAANLVRTNMVEAAKALGSEPPQA